MPVGRPSLDDADLVGDVEGVLIFLHWMSYISFTARRILALSARTSTMNTSVLFSSIFFMADSVVRGCLRTWNWSRRSMAGTDLRGYAGLRARICVLGRWKDTVVCTFRDLDFLATFRRACAAAFCALPDSAAMAPPPARP